MGGRVYDPHLGRFLSADPFVQAPTNTQSLNRYSYVFNNPMSYTDPSGYLAILGFEVGGWVGQVADQIGFHLAEFDYWMHTDESGGAQAFRTAVVVAACSYGMPACAAANGLMTYYMTGDLRQGLKAAAIAAASSAVANSIGDTAAEAARNGNAWTTTEIAVAHGLTQGAISVAGQGHFSWRTFGSSFASAYVGHEMGDALKNWGADNYTSIFLSGALGGVSSRIAGGSFSDGFITAAMVHLFTSYNPSKSNQAAEGDSNPDHISDKIRVDRGLGLLSSKEGLFGEITVGCEFSADMCTSLISDMQGINTSNGKKAIALNIIPAEKGETPTVILTQSEDLKGVNGAFGWNTNKATGEIFNRKLYLYPNRSSYTPTTAVHEIGHMLGLEHQPNSTRNFMSYSPYRRTGPDSADITNLVEAYK